MFDVCKQADAEAINLELLLADAAHVERRLEKTTCRGEEREALEVVLEGLQRGVPARAAGLTDAQLRNAGVRSMGLLTLKPVLYTFNVDEEDFAPTLPARDEAMLAARRVLESLEYCDASKDCFTVCSATLEAAISQLESAAERRSYLEAYGVEPYRERPDGLLCYNVLPTMVREMLGLSLAYTGPGVAHEATRTTKAHLFRRGGLTAAGLAARVHGDIEKGFVRAEVVPAATLLQFETYGAARDSGSMRTEGREYRMADDDVVLIKWK